LTGFGQYAIVTWTLFTCNTIVPQILWIRPLRRKESVLFIVSIIVLVGMWLERFMIISTTLSRDYLPSSWGMFLPTIWDIATIFSLGVFLVAFLLFARFLPILSMSETRAMLPGAHGPEVGR
jgi:molybdopterin-containing oxidoreductase family membrane subunit